MSRTLQARDFGARGDGLGLETAALQQAIDAAAASGATVLLGPGRYRSGALFLKSGMRLRLEVGACLLGSQDLADYPLLPTRVAGIEMAWPAALLNVIGQQDVEIGGAGIIDGDGQTFWDSYWTLRRAYEPRGLRWAADYDAQRPRLIQIFESSRVRVGDGLLLRRSGFWTLHICYSQQVTVDGLTIRNNDEARGPSTDGIDIDSSRQVLIQHADIAVNDDALCIKAGRDADGLRVARCCEDVLIQDCIVREGAAGITFGSETSGGFRDVEVRRLTVLAPVPVGILFKSAPSRGGGGQGLRLREIGLLDVPVVLRVTMNWNPAYSLARLPEAIDEPPAHWQVLSTPVPPEQGMARLREVRIEDLRARGALTAFEVDAFDAAPLQDFAFSRLDIEARRGGHIRDTQGWRFEHCRLQFADAPIAVADSSSLHGLPAGSWVAAPALARRDVSALGYDDQDTQ